MRVRPRSALNLLAAAIVSAAVLYASFVGAGPLPALGPAFNPTTGAWTMALDASLKNDKLHLAGLRQPVTITLEQDGTSHVVANTDHDIFLAVGNLHARFELQLGLLRTAQQEFSAVAPDSRSRQAIDAYAQGVNDRITEAEATHQLPAMFTLLGYQPKPWTPIDSLIVKGDMTQT